MKHSSVIRNPLLAAQLRDFGGLQFHRGIMPTDIDGYMEIDDRIFVFIELKHRNARMPAGQRLALERLVDAIAAPRRAILLIGRHDTPLDELIPASLCMVAMYRMDGCWHIPHRPITVRDAIDKFLEWAS